MRASELCDLNIGDLPVRHGKPSVWVRDGKGKVTRTVDIPESLIKRLERFVRLYRKGARAKAPLLVSTKGKRMISGLIVGDLWRATRRRVLPA